MKCLTSEAAAEMTATARQEWVREWFQTKYGKPMKVVVVKVKK